MTENDELYYLVSFREMKQIQNDCKYPDIHSCYECPEFQKTGECPFGANILIDRIVEAGASSEKPKEKRNGDIDE